jgi:hypothetical protein
LLGRNAANRQRLEQLATLDLLRREHFTRTHLCSRCDSARLHAFEACPSCGSGNLLETSIVHHYRCGWQEPEPRFVKDHELVCPKCRRELRHYGVDYDKPGSVVVCRSCQAGNSEPAVRFICLDCEHNMGADEARTLDWCHYELTEAGLDALRVGRIPRFNIGEYLNGHSRTFALRDFRLLANEGIQVARRYGRPFTIGIVSFVNVRELRRDLGLTAADQAFCRAVDIVVERLRDSDFIGVDDSHSIFIGFPETNEKDARAVLDNLVKQVEPTAGMPITLDIAVGEGEQAGDLLRRNARP